MAIISVTKNTSPYTVRQELEDLFKKAGWDGDKLWMISPGMWAKYWQTKDNAVASGKDKEFVCEQTKGEPE